MMSCSCLKISWSNNKIPLLLLERIGFNSCLIEAATTWTFTEVSLMLKYCDDDAPCVKLDSFRLPRKRKRIQCNVRELCPLLSRFSLHQYCRFCLLVYHILWTSTGKPLANSKLRKTGLLGGRRPEVIWKVNTTQRKQLKTSLKCNSRWTFSVNLQDCK